jgi:hypothetical protein
MEQQTKAVTGYIFDLTESHWHEPLSSNPDSDSPGFDIVGDDMCGPCGADYVAVCRKLVARCSTDAAGAHFNCAARL